MQFSQNVIWCAAGASDRLIQDFHDAFQIEQGSSADVPNDQYEISGANSDGSKFNIGRSGTGLSGLEACLKYSPSDQHSEERWALLAGAGLPTGTSEFTQNGLLEDVSGYPDYQTYIDIGLRSRLSRTLVLDAAVRENILHSQGTTDITLMIGMTYEAWP